MKKLLGLIMLILFHSYDVASQLSYYSFDQDTINYPYQSLANILGDRSNSGLKSFLNGSGVASTTATVGEGIPIGFDFEFEGIIYDRFGVVNTGWIALGRSQYGVNAVDIGQLSNSPLNANGPATDTLRARISALSANIFGNGYTSMLSYETFGESPNRSLIVRWSRYQLPVSGSQNFTNINFEIALNEMDNSIEIHYGDFTITGINQFLYCQIGLGGLETNDFISRKTEFSPNWNTTSAGLTSAATCLLNASMVKPVYGLSFKYTPAPCFPVTNVDVNALTSDSLALSWSSGESTASYEYVLNQNSTPPTIGNISSDTFFHIGNLLLNTAYYFHLRSICGMDSTSIWKTYYYHTPCTSSSLPYTENFDALSVPDLPECFLTLNANANSPTWIVSDYEAQTYPNHLFMDWPGSYTVDDWVLLPPFSLQADTTYLLTFDYNAPTTTFFVGFGRTPLASKMMLMDTIITGDTYQYQQYAKYFTPDSSGTYYLGLYTQNYYQSFDNIYFNKSICDSVYNLTATELLEDAAKINWNGNASSYEYYLLQGNTIITNGIEITSADSIIFNFLETGTTYKFFIRSICTNAFSLWQQLIFSTSSHWDECSNTDLVPVHEEEECPFMSSFSTIGATQSSNTVSSCGITAKDDVWLHFIPTHRSHKITILNANASGGGGGGTRISSNNSQLVSGELIAEVYKGNCMDSLILCSVIPPAQSRTLNFSQYLMDSTYTLRVYSKDSVFIGKNFGVCITSFDPPANDACVNAISLTVNNACQPLFQPEYNLAATASASTPVSTCNSGPYYDIWYTFTATDTIHLVEALFRDGGIGNIELFEGNCGSLSLVKCFNNAQAGVVTLQSGGLVPGNNYYVRAYDATNTGPNTRVSVCVKNGVVNDECENATWVTVTEGKTLQNYLTASTAQASGSGSCGDNYADDDVWYRFVATKTKHLIIAIPVTPSPSITDPVIELFGSTCTSASILCTTGGELSADNLIIGQTYYFRVYSKAYGQGKGNFRVGITAPPDYYKCEGALQVTVSGEPFCNTVSQASMIGLGVKNELWVKFTAENAIHSIQCTGTSYGEPDGLSLYDSCNASYPIVLAQTYGKLYYKSFIPGHTYYLRMARLVFPPAYNYYQDTMQICISSPPVNDECDGAIALPIDTVSSMHTFSNVSATPSSVINDCNFGSNNYDVWFKFTATETYHRVEISGAPYIKAQVIDSCQGNILSCFGDTFGSPKAISALSALTAGQTYYIRVSTSNPYSIFDTFNIVVLDAPYNDYCNYAQTLVHSSVVGCVSEYEGTLQNATSTDNIKDVWYVFKAQEKNITIKITPYQPDFTPDLELFESGNGITYDNCTYVPVFNTYSVVEHLPYEPIYRSYTNLIIGNTYYIRVFNETYEAKGDFYICISNPNSITTILSASYNVSRTTTGADAGTWHKDILHGRIQYTGETSGLNIEEFNVALNDSAMLPYIEKAYIYFDHSIDYSSDIVINKPINFGKAGDIFGYPYYPPVLFAEADPDSLGHLLFKGMYPLSTASQNKKLKTQKFYLILDIKCNTPPGLLINGTVNSIRLGNGELIFPTRSDTLSGLYTSPLVAYHTKQQGNWKDNNTWMCDNVPPDDYDLNPIEINHDIYLEDTVNCGDININYKRTLTLGSGAMLELGRNSDGANTGYSNKILNCTEGSLVADSSTIIVNGGLLFGHLKGDQLGDGFNGQFWLIHDGDTLVQRQPFLSHFSQNFYVGTSSNFNIENVQSKVKSDNSNLSLFREVKQNVDVRNNTSENKTALEINLETLAKINTVQPKIISVNIPVNGVERTFKLTRTISQNPNVYTMPGHKLWEPESHFIYHGKVDNEKGSATLIIYKDHVVGSLMIDGKPYALFKKNINYEMYAYEADPSILPVCIDTDDAAPYNSAAITFNGSGSEVYQKCIHVLLEVENDIVVNQGSVSNAYDYISSLFNIVVTLYEADSINIKPSELLFWTTPSPYQASNAQTILDKFSNAKNEYNGDLALFMSNKIDGGYAYVNGLCSNERKYSCGFASWTQTYAALPQYSWPVEVIAHELGHLLGSRHTHACVWNGNGTPIDGCAAPEGNCNLGPIPTDGGTIMSYCHQNETGINFNKGFGQQPRNVIWNNILNSTCLSSCNPTACTQNLVNVSFKTDAAPKQTSWEIRDMKGMTIAKGGPYNSSFTTMDNYVCVSDGWYKFICSDATYAYPSGILDLTDTYLSFDGNDGTVLGSLQNKANLHMFTSNFQFKDVNINFKDPSYNLFNFGFQPYNSGLYYLTGKVSTGGGDDSASTMNNGFTINNNNDGASNALMRFDTMQVSGGLYTQNRHTRSAKRFNWYKNLIVDSLSEYSGGMAIEKDIINNGVITVQEVPYKSIMLGGTVDVANQYLNTTDTQYIKGSGFYRLSFNEPYPASQSGNRINSLFVNSQKGVVLQTSLKVYDMLVMRHGRIQTDSIHLLTVGDTTHIGNIFADVNNPNIIFIDDTTTMVHQWNGGWVNGPLRRYFNGSTAPHQSLLPVGDSTMARPIAVNFDSTVQGYLTATFHSGMPANNGLPLFDEQGTNIMQTASTGYWNVENLNCTGSYNLHANATGFKDALGLPITNISDARLIKRTNNTWIHTNSTTNAGPASLSNIALDSIIGFSDFTVGQGQDTSLCGLWVYESADGVKGSLRYVLNNCATNGSTIQIIAALDSVSLQMDTLLINKNVTISSLKSGDYTSVYGKPLSKMMEIAIGKIVTLKNMAIVSDNTNGEPALQNLGTLTLDNLLIKDKNGQAKVVNKAEIIVKAGVEVR